MRLLNAVVVTAALGTFVDVLDLTLFQSVRVASLRDLGVSGEDVFKLGIMLLNVQLAGLLIGGFLWGAIADKRGRRTVLFASILTYSLTTLACAWVNSVPLYALLRFVGGIGLAGEMGAGIALIVEVMPRDKRGYGTTICAAAGVSGAIGGGILATHLPWRTAYIIGGVLGLGLFLLRATTKESAMFTRSVATTKPRGIPALFREWKTARRFLLSLALGLPIFFVLLIIAPFAPEIGAALPPGHAVTAALGTGSVALGLTLGDVATGLLSQKLRSRKRPIALSLALLAAVLGVFFFVPLPNDRVFAAFILLLGFSAGYFVLFLTNAAEQFGTNLRGTASVSAPNIMRAMVIPMTLIMKKLAPSIGLRGALVAIAGVCIAVAALALRALPETFGRDLDYDE
jgi:MFS transporter, putative metabolite:H+ symporter